MQPPRPAEVETLGSAGRRTRLAVGAVVLALLLGGTVWGEDPEFPFVPRLPHCIALLSILPWERLFEARLRLRERLPARSPAPVAAGPPG